MESGIWPTDRYLKSHDYGQWRLFQSARCGGNYLLSGSASAILEHYDNNQRMFLTEAIRRLRLGSPPIKVDSNFLTKSQTVRKPTLSERYNRGIAELCRLYPDVDADINIGRGNEGAERFMGATFCRSESEMLEFIKEYEDQGIIKGLSQAIGGPSHFYLTFDARLKAESSAIGSDGSNQVFVAMWFSDEMSDLWQNGIEPGVREAGYSAFRIDGKEHNNKIDDEIIAEIRRSKFLVADFTSERDKPRGGVYYEAGFAQGLGLPVIWTCRANLIDQVHFDTRQFNHIVWDTAEELRDKLTNRIRATIGQGPL